MDGKILALSCKRNIFQKRRQLDSDLWSYRRIRLKQFSRIRLYRLERSSHFSKRPVGVTENNIAAFKFFNESLIQRITLQKSNIFYAQRFRILFGRFQFPGIPLDGKYSLAGFCESKRLEAHAAAEVCDGVTSQAFRTVFGNQLRSANANIFSSVVQRFIRENLLGNFCTGHFYEKEEILFLFSLISLSER